MVTRLTETRTISNTDALFSVTLIKAPVGAFITVFDENRVPIDRADVYINGILRELQISTDEVTSPISFRARIISKSKRADMSR